MTYVIKRKFQGLLGDEVDNSQMATFVQQVQTNVGETTGGVISDLDTLIVNHLVVKKTMRIPVGTDKYK